MPSRMLSRIENPIPEIINAGPVLLEKEISRLHSSFEIYPSLYKLAATLTPKGNPQSNPTTNATIAYPFTLKSFSKAARKNPIFSKWVKHVIISVRIKNGKTELITELKQSRMPFFTNGVIFEERQKEKKSERESRKRVVKTLLQFFAFASRLICFLTVILHHSLP
jgi:hypothetical protein